MAYKFNKRDGIAVGTLCAVALGIVLISNQPNVKTSQESQSVASQSSSVSKTGKSSGSNKSTSTESAKKSETPINGKALEESSSKTDEGLTGNSSSSEKASVATNSNVKHIDSSAIKIGTTESLKGARDKTYTQAVADTKGVYDSDSVEAQSKKVDDNPSYIDKNNPYMGGAEIQPLTIGDWKFVKGNGNGLYAINKNTSASNYYELSDAVDWALFNGQVNLSDGDYDKVVRFFNTTKAYMKAHNIEINGFGG